MIFTALQTSTLTLLHYCLLVCSCSCIMYLRLLTQASREYVYLHILYLCKCIRMEWISSESSEAQRFKTILMSQWLCHVQLSEWSWMILASANNVQCLVCFVTHWSLPEGSFCRCHCATKKRHSGRHEEAMCTWCVRELRVLIVQTLSPLESQGVRFKWVPSERRVFVADERDGLAVC
jgi:hypothetical protein